MLSHSHLKNFASFFFNILPIFSLHNFYKTTRPSNVSSIFLHVILPSVVATGVKGSKELAKASRATMCSLETP